MKGQANTWYAPARQREEQARLEREATRLLLAANRRNQHKKKIETMPQSGPRRYTLTDLKELRRRGLVP